MARLIGPFKIVGKVGDVSFYQLPGSDEIWARSITGPTSEEVKTSEKFVNTRKHNAEFSGASSAARRVLYGLGDIKNLKDHNFYGELTKFLTRMRKSDLESAWGQRAIRFSKSGNLLDGFNLNRSKPFDSVLRHPLAFNISRENSSASVQLPELMPNYNFYPQKDQSFYEVKISLVILPDVVFNQEENRYSPTEDLGFFPTEATTGWHPIIEKQASKTLEVTLDKVVNETCSLLLSIGVQYGTMLEDGYVQPVNKVGSGKILAVR